ncbi:MAG: SCO family protein [Pseudomonadota bacterium]|nr:SCO family protein [Pseudomonadota bacterium]
MKPTRIFAIAILALAAIIGTTAIIINNLRDTGGGSGFATTSVSLGGPFTLTDNTGRRVTEADFKGSWLLVYFGYTYCPDVCPTELQEMAVVMDMLGDAGNAVVPVFITVDPERDTTEAMAEYVAAFHPRMVGLTGSLADISSVAKEYRVYYGKVKDPGGDPDAYLMDHSSFIYLMRPDGRNAAVFNGRMPAAEMAQAIDGMLRAN